MLYDVLADADGHDLPWTLTVGGAAVGRRRDGGGKDRSPRVQPQLPAFVKVEGATPHGMASLRAERMALRRTAVRRACLPLLVAWALGSDLDLEAVGFCRLADGCRPMIKIYYVSP